MTDYKPSVDTTIFPRRNFLQTRTERLLNRMAGGRVYQEIDKYFNRASLDLQFANSKSLTDSKTGKNLVTHTRASSATYVDDDGVIKNAVTNLLTYSEEFGSATVYRGSVTSDQIIAPDGSLSADLFTENTDTGNHIVQATSNYQFTSGVIYTYSVYLKPNGRTNIRVKANNTTTFVADSSFDLIGNGSVASGSPISGTADIQNVGNGWYRCSITGTAGSAALTGFTHITSSGTGDGTSGVYIWGAQLEESSTAGEYVKTTSTINSAPRFDHDPATGESLGLLAEEARTNLVPYSASDLDNRWEGAGTPNVVDLSLNELGVFDGVRVVSNGQSWHGLRTNGSNNAFVLTASTTYTASVWYKDGDINPSGKIRFSLKKTGISQNCFVYRNSSNPLNVSDYVIGNNANHGTISNISVTEFANDVYRVSFNFVPAATGNFQVIFATQSTTIGESVIALGFQIEEGVFPTSYIPTNGSTVTRAADVTKITGNDFGTYNLLEYSQDFDNSYWVKANAAITPNYSLAPDNTFTADAIEDTAGFGTVYRFANVANLATYTFSIYAKNIDNSSNAFTFLVTENGSSTTLIKSTLDFTTGAGSVSDVGSISYENVGNGWYRIQATFTYTNSSNRIYLYAGLQGDNSTGKVAIWGAQLEKSSTATPYVKSDVTFTSRASTATYYDYNGVIQTAAVDEARNVAFLPDGLTGNFVSAGELLLEEARTNLITSSEDFNTALALQPYGSGSIENAATAPNGTQTADFIAETTGTLIHRGGRSFPVTNGSVYTVSCYLKAGTRTKANLQFTRSLFHYLTFDLINGTVSGNIQTNEGTIENVGNGWYRCTMTSGPATANENCNARVELVNDNGDRTYTGDGVSGLYVWGLQVEEGSYATSYIPTFGVAATRAADVSSSSSSTLGNSFFNPAATTVFADVIKSFSGNFDEYPGVYTFKDENVDNRITCYAVTNTEKFTNNSVKSGGVSQIPYAQINANFPGPTRIAQAVATDSCMFAGSGGLTTEDTSLTMPVGIDRLDIGFKGGYFRRLTYWPERLPNATLQTITIE